MPIYNVYRQFPERKNGAMPNLQGLPPFPEHAPHSSSALIVIAVIDTAAWSAAGMHGSSNTGVPTAAIAKARRRGSIIATGSVGIDNAGLRTACRIMVHF
jgi:hypothetical protein